MKRVLLSVAALLISLVAICFPLLFNASSSSSSAGSDPVVVNEYKGDFTLDPDGTLHATETVVAQFPYGRHGIFRFFDVASSYDEGVRYIPETIQVTMDGAAVPVELSWESNKEFRVAKIGDPNSLVSPGVHTYQLTYRVDGTIGRANKVDPDGETYSWGSDDDSMFIWRVVGDGWQLPMQRTESTVRLPAEPQSFTCSAKSADCEVAAPDARTRVVTTGPLQPMNGVAVRADLPFPAPKHTELPWSIHYDPVFGRSLIGLIVALVLSVITFFVGLWMTLRSRETAPLQPVMYAPPPDPGRPGGKLSPAQAFYVSNEHMPTKGLTATLFYLAEEGAVKLDRSGKDGTNWTVTSTVTPEQLKTLDPSSQAVLKGLNLTEAGSTFAADRSADAGRMLTATQGMLDSSTEVWGSTSGAIEHSNVENAGRALVMFAVVAAVVCLIFGFLPATIWVLPLLAFVIGGAGLYTAGVGTRRTKLGRDLWSQSAGFERLLSTRSNEERLDFSARKNLFTDYIPYAIAFGCADAWADKYRYATGQEPPEPSWFGGGFYAPMYIGGFGGSGSAFDSFESNLSSSLSAYSAQQAASSSSSSGGSFGGGGFGGGFGGGGGGGGGGGSW